MATEEQKDIMNKQARGKQKCRECGRKSLSGLSKGFGMCSYHWNEFNWGVAWVDKCVAQVKP